MVSQNEVNEAARQLEAAGKAMATAFRILVRFKEQQLTSDVVSMADAQRMLKLKRRAIVQRIQSDTSPLTGYKEGALWYVDRASIDQHLAASGPNLVALRHGAVSAAGQGSRGREIGTWTGELDNERL